MKSKASVKADDHLCGKLLEIWRTLLESTELTIDDDFFESGGDSLLAVEFVLEVERQFGISIPDSLLFEASTVRRLVDIFSRSPTLHQKSVYPVSGTNGQRPLFFFHGDWTKGGFYVKNLARSLGPELPLVAVAPHGIKGGRIPHSLEEMAAERLPEILAFQPEGPFRLGGHCVGGMIALETARLLVAGGHDVQVVAMIDPIWTGTGKPWPTLEFRVDLEKSSSPDLPDMTATRESVQRYEQALATYIPVLLPVPIVVFSAVFDGRLWYQVSPDFKLFEIPGGHFDLVTARSDVFAAQLRDQLKGIAGRTRPHVSAAHLEKLVHELYGAVRDLRLKARVLTEERDDLRAQVATFAEERASLKAHAEALATDRDDLKGAVAERNEELAAFRASSSWRITAPLRRTARFLRSGKALGERFSG